MFGIRKDLACAKSLGDAGRSLCRSYLRQRKLILSIKVRKKRVKEKDYPNIVIMYYCELESCRVFNRQREPPRRNLIPKFGTA
jgi:hypothetical protein